MVSSTQEGNTTTTAAAAPGDAAEEESETTPIVVVNDQQRCSVAKCPVRGQPKYPCANAGCNKFVHMTCYVASIINRDTSLQALPGDGSVVACTKKCHKEVNSKLNPSESGDLRNTWDVDGKNGKDDSHNSMSILLDWWTTQGNYDKYRGKNNNGTKKIQSIRYFCLNSLSESQLEAVLVGPVASAKSSLNVCPRRSDFLYFWRKTYRFDVATVSAVQ